MRILLLVLSLSFITACSEPLVMIPGGKLSGEVKATPTEWSNVPDTIQVEFRPMDPYSINIWGVGIGKDLYIATGGDGTNWTDILSIEVLVRARVNGDLYELIASPVTDDTERAKVLDAYVKKYEIETDGFVQSGKVFRLDRRK